MSDIAYDVLKSSGPSPAPYLRHAHEMDPTQQSRAWTMRRWNDLRRAIAWSFSLTKQARKELTL